MDARTIQAHGYFEPPGTADDKVKMERAREAIRTGQKDPVKMVVNPQGKLEVEDGRHRLRAAIEMGAKVKVQFNRGRAGGGNAVFRGGN